jgi:hypothetical protein
MIHRLINYYMGEFYTLDAYFYFDPRRSPGGLDFNSLYPSVIRDYRKLTIR